MRWSVGIEAEGDRVLTREEVVELADAVAASDGIATGIGTSRYGAQLVVEAGSRDEAIEKATAEFRAGRGQGRAARRARSSGSRRSARTRTRTSADDPARLAGRVPVRGAARCSAGWTPPAAPAVYAILYKPDPDTKPDRYAVIYVGHSDDLSTERFPFQHPRAALLGAAGRVQVEGVHRHLRGTRRRPGRTASRSPAS